ncbi:MAG: hypothetical protein HOM55_07245 [Proteobacteria bacterium]|nr:hypothetical protein [Pseudomonadota bacterium]
MKWQLSLIVVLFLVVTGFHILPGPMLAGDSDHYLLGAEELKSQGTISGKATRYSSYVAIISAIKMVTDNRDHQLKLIVAFQILILMAALLCLYGIGRRLFGTPAALIAAALFAMNFYLLQWAPYILTETMFTSFVIISAYLCLMTSEKPRFLLPSIGAVLITTTLRPNGIALLPVFLCYLITRLNGFARLAAVILLAATIIGTLPILQQILSDTAGNEMLVDKLESGTIVWEFDSMDMPKLANRGEDQVADMFRYLTTWPVESARLMATRLYAAYFYQRSDYSLIHRMLLVVVIPGVLLLALVGLVAAIRRKNSAGYLLPAFLILAQSAVIAISFADHDHRFISYIMPLIFLFTGFGATVVWDAALSTHRSN